MFDTFKNKLQIVQEGITAGLKNLTTTDNPRIKKPSANLKQVNYGAGADLLHHFQQQWNELHDLSEENSIKAREVDILIGGVYEKIDRQWHNIVLLNSALATIPKINNDIKNLMDQLGTLEEAFEEVEASLYNLENLNEILELQNHQLDHRFQLALYKEKKLSHLDTVRAKLADEHSKRVVQYELKNQKILQERQQTFEKVFRDDIEIYKATGELPKAVSPHKGPTLEEIDLEDDTTDFDDFLKS